MKKLLPLLLAILTPTAFAAEPPADWVAAGERRRDQIPLGGDFKPDPKVPAFVAVGHGGGALTGGCYLRLKEETPMANLFVTTDQHPLPAETVTVAEILKGAGYATAAVGKWGMGMFDTSGSPLKQGFDHFFGYNCHPQSRPTPFLWEYGRQRDYLYTRRIRHAQSESRHPRWSMKAPPQR